MISFVILTYKIKTSNSLEYVSMAGEINFGHTPFQLTPLEKYKFVKKSWDIPEGAVITFYHIENNEI
jgi:hypothetical protein